MAYPMASLCAPRSMPRLPSYPPFQEDAEAKIIKKVTPKAAGKAKAGGKAKAKK